MDDGTLLARKPFVPRDIGSNMAKSPTFVTMSSHQAGTYVAVSPVDGVRRMVTYARVPGTPLIAAVAPAVDEVLAPWWHRSRIAGALTLAFGTVFVMVSWLLAFALRDKLRAQAALLRLAATDPLTGLGNRRVLDNRLDEEWRRARRSGRPLSVLFIDIDHFKQFNDVYGHACGDEALSAVAECISATVRRSVDVVARYGGEEFAVVLPETIGRGRAQCRGENPPQGAESARRAERWRKDRRDGEHRLRDLCAGGRRERPRSAGRRRSPALRGQGGRSQPDQLGAVDGAVDDAGFVGVRMRWRVSISVAR